MADIRTLHLKHDCRLLIIDWLLLESGRLWGSPALMPETADSLSALSGHLLKLYFIHICCLCLVHVRQQESEFRWRCVFVYACTQGHVSTL